MRLFSRFALAASLAAFALASPASAASLIYDSFNTDIGAGNIVPSTDTFYAMLVTSSYTPNKGTHTKRSDVTNEASGTGYTSGGSATTATVATNTSTHAFTITFSDVTWASSTITAAAAVIYKHRGGASSADNLVAYIDFGGNVSTTSGTFTLHFTGPLTIQN